MRILLPLLVFVLSLNAQGQEKPIDNALLWKVTGKSLLKPSFLFGTIHLQDQRVFNFNDSLYSFIKSADGFAMEIHPDSVISALMQKAEENTSGKLLRQHLSKDEFSQVSRKLKRELGIDAGRLTLKDAYLLKDHLSKPAARDDDMPTFVDAYLFGVARNQGKEIVGLEKATDQMHMLDDIKGEFDVKQLLKGMKKEKNLTERLVQLYIREDLKEIHNLMSYLPQETEDKLLNLRNHLMVLKMDSLIQAKSYVVAVGTAHLPGKKGMIELLRQKGYKVEPVFATTRTHANNYAIKAAQTLTWIDVEEPQLGYSMRMPGKPSPMDMLNGSMKMNMYMDLASMKLYYAAFVVPAINVTKQNADSILEAMCKNAMASSKGETISRKRFAKGKFEVIDFVYKQTTDKMFARVQAIAMGKRVYLVGFGSPRKEDVATPDADKFFDSFTILDMPGNPWEVQTFKEYYFRVALPSKANAVKLPAGDDTTISTVQFSSTDNNSGAYYGLAINTANPGFSIREDSAYFTSSMERLQEVMELRDLVQKDTLFEGFPARKVRAKLNGILALNCFMISRGNRMYTLSAITNLEDSAHADIALFFKSFSFIDYPTLAWQPTVSADLGITIPTTGAFSRITFLDELEDSAKSAREFEWLIYDSATATSFFVTRRPLSPYLWVKHDSVLLKQYRWEFAEEGGVETDYKFLRHGNNSAIEFNIKNPGTCVLQRIRVVLNGNAVYILQADAPGQYWAKNNYQHFLEGFRLEKELNSDFLYTNSFKKLLADLSSTDSAKHSAAYDAIYHTIFDSTDNPALLQAGTVEYPLDSLHDTPTGQMLLYGLDYRASNICELIANHYNTLTPAQEQFKFSLLYTLADQGTEQSFATIEKLLKKGVPLKGESGPFVHRLGDSLQLAKKLYPFLITLSADSLLGIKLFSLHEDMVDSGHVSIDAFRPYQHLMTKLAWRELKNMAADTTRLYYTFAIYSVMRVLQALKTDTAKLLLRKFAGVRQTNISMFAAISLLRMKQPIDGGTLQSIAADKFYRTMFYDSLVAMKQEKLFPAKYFNQRSFGEGYIFQGFSEGDEPDRVQFLGQRIAIYKGKKQKFYLYKAIYGAGDENAVLCIAGAFDMTGKKVPAGEDISGMYRDEDFSASQIDRHFKAYLALWEKAEEEEE